MKKLIVGLGNPGSTYQNTKHNIGFQLLETFAEQEGIELQSNRNFISRMGKKIHEDETWILLLPETFMNLSGRAVQKCVSYYKIDQVLVVCDDVVLGYGQMRLRQKGSSGGHNGLQSVIEELGTVEFSRLRLGVGRNDYMSLESDVLSKFSLEQMDGFEEFMHRGCLALRAFLELPVGKAMEKVAFLNRKKTEGNVDEKK